MENQNLIVNLTAEQIKTLKDCVRAYTARANEALDSFMYSATPEGKIQLERRRVQMLDEAAELIDALKSAKTL